MDKFAPEERLMPKPGGTIWVKAIAEDGTFGLGRTDSGHATQPIISECLAPLSRWAGSGCHRSVQ
ncbi:MAG: hypothetical protein J4F35_06170 [Candidatus Latescibacteria bacterium]|nr:hypothetical protein [Candidatus Latescibacterota bacterium]